MKEINYFTFEDMALKGRVKKATQLKTKDRMDYFEIEDNKSNIYIVPIKTPSYDIKPLAIIARAFKFNNQRFTRLIMSILGGV